jgi:hypothetical protein
MGVLINVFSVLAGGGLNRTLPRPQSVEPFFQVTIPEVCDSFFTYCIILLLFQKDENEYIPKPEYAHVKKKPERPPVGDLILILKIICLVFKVTPPRTPQPIIISVCYLKSVLSGRLIVITGSQSEKTTTSGCLY